MHVDVAAVTARAANRSAAARASRHATIRRVTDSAEARRLLSGVRAFGAYALAYMDQRLFALADIYEARTADKFALLVHSRGGLGTSTLLVGEAELAAALLRLHPGPHQSFLTCQLDHVEKALETHNLWRPQNMLRMQLDLDAFEMPAELSNVRRLEARDAEELNRLYAIEGDGLHYNGRQVEQGVYYGGFVRERLVAAAGTHIYSLKEHVAVIGNVYTHPDHRNHGLGTAVTAAVAAQLKHSCNLIVLNVDPANRTARHIYEQLGFREQARLVEAMATRREGFVLLPLLRRALARWRAHKPGVELVQL